MLLVRTLSNHLYDYHIEVNIELLILVLQPKILMFFYSNFIAKIILSAFFLSLKFLAPKDLIITKLRTKPFKP